MVKFYFLNQQTENVPVVQLLP